MSAPGKPKPECTLFGEDFGCYAVTKSDLSFAQFAGAFPRTNTHASR
jgi:hypothetical protein